MGFLASMLLLGCALPIEELWPPPPDSGIRTIYVSLDTWHAMIAFPRHDGWSNSGERQKARPASQPAVVYGHSQDAADNQRFEEWGYAERAWYLEGRRGLTGAIRALFWPTEGVVEVGQYNQVWAERTPQPPSDLFIFQVSEEGYRRLRRHLDTTLMDRKLIAAFDSSRFYAAKHAYHAFHTCHQYAAQSLREAGLPISPFWAFSRSSFAWQLKRASRIAGEPSTTIPLSELP